jgi:hypothetical protein
LKILPGVQITVPSGPSRFSEALRFGGPGPALASASLHESEDEMQAVADALSLLANVVMAWNTAKMQAIFDRCAQRRSGAIPPELIARIAPTRTEGVSICGAYSASPSSNTPTYCCRHGVPPKIHVLGQ